MPFSSRYARAFSTIQIDLAVLAADLRREVLDHVVRGHQPLEFVPPRRVDIQLRGDVLDPRLHRFDRIVAVDPRERRVRGQVVAVFGRLENALDRVLEEAAVFVGRGHEFRLHHRSSSRCRRGISAQSRTESKYELRRTLARAEVVANAQSATTVP